MPDIIVTRSNDYIEEETLAKISLFCNVKKDCVIQNIDADSLYKVPLLLEEQNFSSIVCRELGLDSSPCDLTEWKAMVERIESRSKKTRIAIVGKYIKLHDAYLSVVEALQHAGFENQALVDIAWIDSEDVTEEGAGDLCGQLDGILVPGGFGNRGIPGKVQAARFAREKDIPYLGICLGMQVACIEFAKNVLGYKDVNSTEFSPDCHTPVISLMPDQQGNIPKGGTMRLGAYPCRIKPASMMETAYKQTEISERHRHRYEFNNQYREAVEAAGLTITGTSPDGSLVEAVEIPNNRFFVGVQYHPEFKSRPNRAQPLFREFVKAALETNTSPR